MKDGEDGEDVTQEKKSLPFWYFIFAFKISSMLSVIFFSVLLSRYFSSLLTPTIHLPFIHLHTMPLLPSLPCPSSTIPI